MSNPSPAGPPPIPDFTVVPTSPPPPPVGWLPGQPAPSPAESTPTERWGMGDILLGVAVIMGAVIVATIGGLAILGFDTLDPLADGDLSSSDAVIFLGLTTVAQGLAMGAWPVLVARWKGNGVVEDFRWRFKPIDLLSGFGMAIVLLVAGRIEADGTPTDVLTPERIEAAFGAEVYVLDHPGTGAPVVVPVVGEET